MSTPAETPVTSTPEKAKKKELVVEFPTELKDAVKELSKKDNENFKHPRVVEIVAIAKFVGWDDAKVAKLQRDANKRAAQHAAKLTESKKADTKALEKLREIRAALASGKQITDINELKAALGLAK